MAYPNAIEVCRSELFTKEIELRERYPGQMDFAKASGVVKDLLK